MSLDLLSQRLPGDIRLRRAVYDSAAASTWKEWLSEEEQACLAEFGAAVRRREFVAGRAVVRQLLAEVLDTSPREVPIRRAEDGAVEVDRNGWFASISHSDEHAVAACARYPVGVDLEQIKPRDAGIARFLLHPENRREGLIDRLPYDSNTALILCWTLKEAVLKARRSGFRRSPKTLRLDVQPVECRATVHVEGGSAWRVCYEKLDGFMLSVAYSEEGGGH